MTPVILNGCGATPLAGYLKGLGVLRLLALQKDASLRGAWSGHCFALHGEITEEQIEEFFLNRYEPTPLVAPWNGGSGFSPKDNKEALLKIRDSQNPRLARYGQVIREIEQWPEIPSPPETVRDLLSFLQNVAERQKGTKKGKEASGLAAEIGAPPVSTHVEEPLSLPADKEAFEEALEKAWDGNTPSDIKANLKAWKKSVSKGITIFVKAQRYLDKGVILQSCRTRLPDDVLDWLDAAYALTGGNGVSFAPVLGSGANDGRLELTKTFMQRVSELFLELPEEKRRGLLRSALFGDPAEGLVEGKIGFYDPGRAGGYNQGAGIEKKDFTINPWDYVLLFEGLPVLAASVARRQVESGTSMSAPFTVRHSRSGYGSAGEEKDRHETWLPLWKKPATFGEVRLLFREGRSLVGRRAARNGIDFVRSLRSVGVDRGIAYFQRYVYLERRGNNYVALPAGSIAVEERSQVDRLREVDPILQSVDRFLMGLENGGPLSLQAARRRIEENLYALAAAPSPARFRGLVRAFGALERIVVRFREKLKAQGKEKECQRPFLGLSPHWITLCEETVFTTPEVRLAGALASIQATGDVGGLRSYLSGAIPITPRNGPGTAGFFGTVST